MDEPGRLSPVREETNMTRAFEESEMGARDRLGEPLLPRLRDDGIPGSGQNERRSLDPPEPIRKIEVGKLGKSLGHHALIGLPDSLGDEVNQGAGFGFGSVQ
mgnify:CR=1 FL=1